MPFSNVSTVRLLKKMTGKKERRKKMTKHEERKLMKKYNQEAKVRKSTSYRFATSNGKRKIDRADCGSVF